MSEGKPASCPACGKPFACRAAAVHRCDCSGLHLTTEELEYVRAYTEEKFGSYTCLCMQCLNVLKNQYAQLSPGPISSGLR